jgi:hypothetical protein
MRAVATVDASASRCMHPRISTCMECDCSMCSKVRLSASDRAKVTLRTAVRSGVADNISVQYRHCEASVLFDCGVKSFYVPRSHPDGFSVNARCLDPRQCRRHEHLARGRPQLGEILSGWTGRGDCRSSRKQRRAKHASARSVSRICFGPRWMRPVRRAACHRIYPSDREVVRSWWAPAKRPPRWRVPSNNNGPMRCPDWWSRAMVIHPSVSGSRSSKRVIPIPMRPDSRRLRAFASWSAGLTATTWCCAYGPAAAPRCWRCLHRVSRWPTSAASISSCCAAAQALPRSTACVSISQPSRADDWQCSRSRRRS